MEKTVIHNQSTSIITKTFTAKTTESNVGRSAADFRTSIQNSLKQTEQFAAAPKALIEQSVTDIYQQNCRFHAFMPEKAVNKELQLSTEELMEQLREKIQEIYEKVKNGETEESFQIGGRSFTQKEWKKFLEGFDDIQEAFQELLKEEAKRKLEEKEENLVKIE